MFLSGLSTALGRLKQRRLAVLGVVAVAAAVGFSATALAGKRHGFITGTAKTECGKPLSSFLVSAHGFDGHVNVNPAGLPFLGQTKGRGGHYALQTRDSIRQRKPVNALVRAVDAQTTVRFRGLNYVLALDPTDGKPNGTAASDFRGYSGNGIIRDFVLRTSGLKPGFGRYRHLQTEGTGSAAGAFYGGNLILALSFYPQSGQTLTVTLAPTGSLVDGCRARTITRTVDLGRLNATDVYLHSLPLTGYTLSATLGGPGARPLRLHHLGETTGTTSLPVQFVPTPELPDGSGSVSVDAG